MIRRRLRLLGIIIKCIFHIDGWEWYSPAIRKHMERMERDD